MKKLFLTALVLLSTYSFAGLDKGVREATLKANKSFDLGNLDRVGSIIKNKRTGEILYNHCQHRDEKQECTEIIHILSVDEKNLILHDRKNQEIKQSVLFLKMRMEMEFGESLSYFSDPDPIYARELGHFTSEIGGICIYEPYRCKILFLLPLTIAADLILLPLDLSINTSQRIITRKRAKLFAKHLESDEEIVELNNRSFLSLLKGLAQF